jgi:N-ethylmaleimide reductase
VTHTFLGGMILPHQSARDGRLGELTAERHPGLVVVEAAHPGTTAQGGSPEQAEAWRRAADAVHAQADRIFLRLTRSGHPYPHPNGALPLSPPAIPFVDVIRTIGDSVSAARTAVGAGFDGVELHGADSHLVPRSPFGAHGGSVEKRIRFAVEVVRAVSDAIGPERTAIRISPAGRDDTAELFTALARVLAPHRLAYLHLVETGNRDMTALVRAEWPGLLVVTPHRSLPTTAEETRLEHLTLET